MRSIILLVLICLTIYAHAQDDYRIYHRWINNAERCFFVENKIDSAYQYYDAAFAKFDFVFAKDCYMAAQIAYYNKNDKYISYLKKGFKNGLRPQDLKLADVFTSLIKDSISFKKKFSDYQALRKVYLKRINVKVLRTVMQNIIADQNEKGVGGDEVYGYKLTNRMRNLVALINAVGFPGEKIVGIEQLDLMSELGYKNEDYPWGMSKPECFESISQYSFFAILVHYPCTYQLFSGKWEQMIIKGQIHPGDVAMLYDNIYWGFSFTGKKNAEEIYGCKYILPFGYYRKNIFLPYKTYNYNDHIVDSMRTALFINTLAVDSAKYAFGDKHGFKTTFGFFDCR